MILFLVHIAAALLLWYVLIRAIIDARRKDLIIPTVGIATLFVIHCITFKASCIQCTISKPECTAEIIMFWFFAGWAAIELLWGNKGRKKPS